ncbi:uncharacterized protein LOC115206503 [Salmo trutta]|uniref:uncharacterized protein LOC115206503 n=1 Tax=Salmo trutta TaxID=8032 RepID=UPI0011313B2B|nr:uncharacterized protein LOC115206503 [Salmo trutta]
MRILMLCPFSTPLHSPVMSSSVIQTQSAGAPAPEALSLLQQCLLVAEEQAEALIRDRGSLGVSREQLLDPMVSDPIQHPFSPLKMHRTLREPGGEGLLWCQCDGLVSRMVVALAVEELKIVKVQMSEKLLQLKDQMSQESAQFFENKKSHSALLQSVDEMERVVVMERRWPRQFRQTAMPCILMDRPPHRQRGEGQRLQEQCEQFKGQAEVKDALVLELTGELKCAWLALQKQQQENSRLLRDGDLRTAADKFQVSSEIGTLKTTCHKLEAQLRQAQAAVQVKEGEVVSAVSARDKALRDSQTLRGQLDKL